MTLVLQVADLGPHPVGVQLRRVAGWRMPPNTIKVCRPGRWGNPFVVSEARDAATCVALFENLMQGVWSPGVTAHLPQGLSGYREHHEWLARLGGHPLDEVKDLHGRNLACFCPLDAPCHRNVLLRLAAAR